MAVTGAQAAKIHLELQPLLNPGEMVEMTVSGTLSPVIKPLKAAAKTLAVAMVTAAATGGMAWATTTPSLTPVNAILTSQRLLLQRRGLGSPTSRVLAALSRSDVRLVRAKGLSVAPSYAITDLAENSVATLTFPVWRRSQAAALAKSVNPTTNIGPGQGLGDAR